MSKKQDRSSRKADLPDWADEVTPADEVMEKFYAPTGLFRPGPISTPKEPSQALPAFQIESGEEMASPEFPIERGIDSVNSPYIPAEDTETAQASTATETAILSSSNDTEKRPVRYSPTNRPQTETAIDPGAESLAGTTLSDSENLLFADFANRWKRYLYPGQLAVMRALYELSFAHGTSECFTRYSEIAASTKMSRRNCINVMNSLVERGFVERLEIRNDATGKGIRLRVHLDPLQ